MRYRLQMLPAQLNLLDSHDVSRFLSLCGGDTASYRLAFLFMMCFVGMPTIFYGDELGVQGMQEEEYRAPMPWKGGDLALLTRYGIVKERFSALLTDALRANLLTCCGYKTQILEFVDFAHTPKNLLIRAVKGGVSPAAREKALREVKAALEAFELDPTLPRLLEQAGLVQGLTK